MFKMPEFKAGDKSGGGLGMLGGLIPKEIMDAAMKFKDEAPALLEKLTVAFQTVVTNTDKIIAQNEEILAHLKGNANNGGDTHDGSKQLTSGS